MKILYKFLAEMYDFYIVAGYWYLQIFIVYMVIYIKIRYIILHLDGPRIEHISFGVVCGEDGKKFKSREGDTVKLSDLLDKAVDECK